MSSSHNEKDLAGSEADGPDGLRESGCANISVATTTVRRGARTAQVLRPIDDYRSRQVKAVSRLFELGGLDDAGDDKGYLRRLNLLLAARTFQQRGRYPADLAAAIDSKGKASPHAEILIFGRWLLTDKMPGVKRSRGQQPNPKIVLKTLTAALSIMRRQERKHATEGATSGKKPLRITKTSLAKEWKRLFDDAPPTSVFDAKIRTLRRILAGFEGQVKSGVINAAGTIIREMPELSRVAGLVRAGSRFPASTATGGSSGRPGASTRALAPASAVSAPAPSPAAAAVPEKFEIELRYSSAREEQSYRGRAPGTLPATKIGYLIEPLSASSEGRTLRKSREGRLVLRPEIDLRRDYRIRALIDRMVILVTTRTKTNHRNLHGLLTRRIGVACYVEDRTLIGKQATGWQARLPKLDAGWDTGYHFAVLIQEPEARNLASILSVIDGAHGIDGPVELFLVELSIDVQPRGDAGADEQIHLRERMVGLLQRQHWAPHSKLTQSADKLTGSIDARQVYKDETAKRTTRYMFSRSRGTRHLSDADADRPEVRTRILDPKTSSDLFVNASVYKGNPAEDVSIAVQHKVADRRNPEKQTHVDLDLSERRARIEICFTGTARLNALGLGEVNDLSRAPFRLMRKDLLTFRLGTATPEYIENAIAQMRSRGIYGLELQTRARERREGEQERTRRGVSGELLKGEGAALVDWQEMNDAVGQALDLLARRWQRFSWP